MQVTCLVELIEMPFTVVACADILLVNLERVGFNLRNFDMTIIFKACRDDPLKRHHDTVWSEAPSRSA